MLVRAEIKGFKCLRDVSTDLGPLNVLIGPNDSGKSSFLQALTEAKRMASGNQMRMATLSGRPRSVRLEADDGESRISFDASGGLTVHVDKSAYVSPASWVGSRSYLRISEPLTLDPAAIAGLAPRGSGTMDALTSSRGRGAAAHLARVALGDRPRYEAIQKGMRDITGNRIREVLVGEDTGQGYPLSFRLHDDTVIPASDVSQGLLLYFAFLTIVHRDDAPAVLLIEEPENGVHPLRLYEVVSLLRTLTERGVQIIMTTHSPDLLNACKPEEILVFRRPEPDSGTEIHRLPADFERRSMRSTLGEIWAASGEEGLLDMLPAIEPPIRAEAG